jgi:hypothetical protein
MLFIFSTPVLISNLWHLKAVVFLQQCLIRSFLLQTFVKNHTILYFFFGPKMPHIIGYFERLANPFDLILALNFPMLYSLCTLSSVSGIMSYCIRIYGEKNCDFKTWTILRNTFHVEKYSE